MIAVTSSHEREIIYQTCDFVECACVARTSMLVRLQELFITATAFNFERVSPDIISKLATHFSFVSR